MELLLRDDVPGLGSRGDIVTVARGYARNYLLPKRLAQVPSDQAVKEVRAQAEQIQAEQAVIKTERMEVAKTLTEVIIRYTMKAGKEGHLYGSVGARQVADSLAEQGYEIDERHIHMEPLKDLGEYEVTVALHPEVLVPVKVVVDPEDVE